MTEKEIFDEFGVKIEIFENELYEDEAFYIPPLKTMFLSDAIAGNDRIKVALHELGHRGHLPHLYQVFREEYELEANRTMIHYLVKEALATLEDAREFNYVDFMKCHNLTTVADEVMVMEEYRNLTK